MPRSATETALRSHLQSHNAAVLMASGVALVFSAIGWAILYGASYWLTMFALTVAHADEGRMPATFNLVFFTSVAVLMLAAWVDQLIFPHERAVDERPPLEHFADILFFVPRFTLSCWQSLAAFVSLRRAEMQQAAELLDRLRCEGRIALQQLPTSFPNERSLRKILIALSIADLVTQRKEQSLTWLQISPLAPEEFRGPPALADVGEDKLAGMQHAKIVERRASLMPRQS